jgi:hypothetical protein
MFSNTTNSNKKDQSIKSLLAKLSNADKYKTDSNSIELSTKSYSTQISNKLIEKVEATLN